LFVDLNAANYNTGDPTWTNAGTGYTDFDVVGSPRRISVETTPGILFNGTTDAFVGMDLAPDGLVGLNPTRSIEAWVLNPSIASEETIVSWGKRGGPDPGGNNMAFNYGNNGRYGAVGHWGGDTFDVGWVDNNFTDGAPEPYEWHHLVYTYDGEVTRVYSDGELWNEEETLNTWGDLDTYGDTPIAVASQWEADAVTLTGALKGSMAISRLRIHDEVLTENQILANYQEEVGSFFNPGQPPNPVPEPIPAGPVHRYSFSEPASNEAEGVVLVDSVGGANGTVVGVGASMTGSELKLSGGPSADAPYADLPNGILSSLTDATLEAWATIDGSQTWGRIFDFGSTTPGGDAGELEEPGGGGEGLDYLALAAQRGDDINTQRLELRDQDPATGRITTVDANIPTNLGEQFHVAVVYDSDGAPLSGEPVLRLYRDGRLVGENQTNIELADINDVNNWLGRSNWTNDANFEGSFDEFRIYDYALTTNQILGNAQAGPDVLNLGNPCDVNGDGLCDGTDFDDLGDAIRRGDMDAKYDLNGDGQVNDFDQTYWVKDLMRTWIGDANLNGEFNSSDLVDVLATGTYEQDVESGWASGDFNSDRRTSSSDLVAALADGGYEAGPLGGQAAVPEPAAITLFIAGLLCLRRRP
jgi:hypothetical protein